MSAHQFTSDDRRRFEQLEREAVNGLTHAVRAGLALAEIKRDKLYLIGHKTFEHFVRERCNLTKAHAYDLITLGRVTEAVSSATDMSDVAIPTIRQARALNKVPRDNQAAAWKEITTTADTETIAPELVEEVTARHGAKRRRRKGKPKPVRFKVPGGYVTFKPTRKSYDLVAALSNALSQARKQETRKAA